MARSAKPTKKKSVKVASKKKPLPAKRVAAKSAAGAGAQAKLLACLKRADGGEKFAGVLASAVPAARKMDKKTAQAVLGLGALALARFQAKRGAPAAHAIIDAVLARWDNLPTDVEGHVEQFLQNALATVGAKHTLAERLSRKVPAAPKAIGLLINHATVLGVAGDAKRMHAALECALIEGATPALLERDEELARLLAKDAKARALVDRYRLAAPSEPRVLAQRASAKKKPTASAESPVDKELAALTAVYEKQLTRLGASATQRDRDMHTVVYGPPADETSIAEAEDRIGIALPADYREFLAEHDGVRFGLDYFTILSTNDLGTSSRFWKLAQSYVSDSAEYGSPELLECIPVAYLGEPNDWLLYDPRNETYLYCRNADHYEIESLAKTIARITKISTS